MPVREGRRIDVRGIVQGVGFRPWVYRLADRARIVGRVRNDSAGVSIDAFGAPADLDTFLRSLTTAAPAAARVEDVRWRSIPDEPYDDFAIAPSKGGGDRSLSIPPDLATCPECLAEIFDPANRRYRYPFTNCTNCGPRFTIARDVPYDRAATSMAGFRMCAECQREYHDVHDRRFHAQPNACPACGPRLHVLLPDGATPKVRDPIRHAADALRAGLIVAVKGLGGYHLACDASSSTAVRRLRARKRRDEKPFAVMARDLGSALSLVALDDQGRVLIESTERPIVLGWRQDGAPVADEIAPDSRLLGVFLPYTPLHHLLLADAGGPLVMTSGNLSDEPIAYRDDEALCRLRGIADLFLAHDREIVTRCDDSVATIIAGGPVVFRRSRGHVPRPVRLSGAVARPVLGAGALLKNTFCLAAGREAWVGPHIGDLENLETYASYQESIERLERFLQIRPEIVAHDLHPEYLSTSYARARRGLDMVAVQHHHAHVASAMAEHGLDGPVIGVAFDGTGYGTDGTAWGGEVLVADYRTYVRVGTCRAVPLPGGDTAIRQPWRITLALLEDAFDGDPPIEQLPLFEKVADTDVALVREMLRRAVNAPLAHGMGRYFDAFGALALARPAVSFEGQLALAFNVIADPAEREWYPWELARQGELLQLDFRRALRQATFEVIGRAPVELVAARFHNTIAVATAELVRTAARRHRGVPVVLTGGCFQNARLTEALVAALSPQFTVYTHRQVPPGDGGIALGQVAIAGGRR